jgi:hypothetical protein
MEMEMEMERWRDGEIDKSRAKDDIQVQYSPIVGGVVYGDSMETVFDQGMAPSSCRYPGSSGSSSPGLLKGRRWTVMKGLVWFWQVELKSERHSRCPQDRSNAIPYRTVRYPE